MDCKGCAFWWSRDDAGQCRRRAPVSKANDLHLDNIIPLLMMLVRCQAKLAEFELQGDHISNEEVNAWDIPSRDWCVWPSTLEDDWCGEWEPIKPPVNRPEMTASEKIA